MTVMYGKWSVWNWVINILTKLHQECMIMDDTDRDDTLLDKADQIIITPGIPPSHNIYQVYGHKIKGELDVCWDIIHHNHLEDQIHMIWITWTDGKSTTSWITYNIIKQLCDNQIINDKHYHVLLWGNFEPPVSDLISTIVDTQIWVSQDTIQHHWILVVEVSSFMASMIHSCEFDWSIFTNFNVDHLNRHPDMKHYFQSKSNLIIHTHHQGFVHPELIEPLHETGINNIVAYPLDFDLSHTHFMWAHNSMNRSASIQCLQALCHELSIPFIIDSTIIWSIKPLHHRTEYIATIDGVRIISDAHGLTGQAQESAIRSFDEKIVLICGWSDKGFDFHELDATYRHYVGASFCFGQTKDHFQWVFSALNIPCFTYDEFDQCIYDAFSYCKEHTIWVLLFSPGCASFDMFRNREERANKRMMIISTLWGKWL